MKANGYPNLARLRTNQGIEGLGLDNVGIQGKLKQDHEYSVTYVSSILYQSCTKKYWWEGVVTGNDWTPELGGKVLI